MEIKDPSTRTKRLTMEKINIHCKTQEIADKVIEKALKLGHRFQYGPNTTERNYWPAFGEDTVYSKERGYIVVGSLDLMSPNRELITGEDYLKHQYP